MAKVLVKMFKRAEDMNEAIIRLKAKGFKARLIDSNASVSNELADAGLSEQALGYYQIGLGVGGKIITVKVEDSEVDKVNELLGSIGFEELSDRPAQWFNSPGFTKAEKMSTTNPIDAQMTGDFRKY